MQYTIAELADEFQVTPRTIRFYEDKGLLSPARIGTRRIFAERDRVRLRLTLRGKRLGLSLDEIVEIIDLYQPDGTNDHAQLFLLLERIQEHRAQLLGKLRDIQETLTLMDQVQADCVAALNRTAKDASQTH